VHFLLPRAVLDRVVEQVQQDLSQRAWVHRRTHPRLQPGANHDPGAGQQRREVPHDVVHQRGELLLFHREQHRPALAPRELERVLDEVRETAGFLVEDLQAAPLLLGRAHPVEAKRLREHPDLGQGRAQLVRYVRHELRAQAGQRPLPPELPGGGEEKAGGEHEQRDERGKARPGKAADDEVAGGRGIEGDAHRAAAEHARVHVPIRDLDAESGPLVQLGTEPLDPTVIAHGHRHRGVRDPAVAEGGGQQRAALERLPEPLGHGGQG